MSSSEAPLEPEAISPDDGADSEAALLRDLRAAWTDRRFTLAYQPQFSLTACRVTAFEALLRWHDPVRGDVSPAAFVPLAEKAGLIDEIGDWVLEQACTEAAGWPDGVNVAVNVSALQLENTALPAVVAACVERSGLPSARLELEITESTIIPADASSIVALHATATRVLASSWTITTSATRP